MPNLRERLWLLDGELTKGRDAGDTHDYSSSGYSGFDDGYITAVYDTITAVEELLKRENLLDERVSGGSGEGAANGGT